MLLDDLMKKNATSLRDFNIDCVMNFDEVRPNIVFKLINTERNKELLKNIPSIKYHDLSIIFCVMYDAGDGSKESLLTVVTNRNCKNWDCDFSELMFAAKRNTERLLPSEIKNIGDVLTDIIDIYIPADIKNICRIGAYVMSNKYHHGGASTMLYRKSLQNFADAIDDDLYIMPTSVDELIIFPSKCILHGYELEKMLKEYNDNKTDSLGILSYSVYYFSKLKGELSVL